MLKNISKIKNSRKLLNALTLLKVDCLAASGVHDGLIQRVRFQLSAAAHAINFHRLTDTNYAKIHEA